MNAAYVSRWTLKGIAILLMFLVASCSSSGSSPTYDAAIQEGRTAAQAIIDQGGASAVTMTLVDANRVIWSQSFGLADRETGQAPTPSTTFGIGSVSKMFAAVAVMKLVDRGIINLDTPLVTYLPAFRMASAGYENITVRMLLNHSSGFPGTDYHNAESYSPMPGYLNQVFQTLSMARLKAPPGFMSVYSNDGFTVTEALIQATTGKSYAQFVQDEILTPLGMTNTRFTLSQFPTGSYAKTYVDGVAQPQEFVSVYASGGVHSTANDMGRLAMMFLGGGATGPTRILSAASVAAMAVDQTAGSFNPVHSNAFAYGLGWDSVSQPGLLAVGFDGWLKGGDITGYGAAIIVSPGAQLGVVVIGASGFGSGQATRIGEQVLLRALAENGRIAAFPEPLPAVVPPTAPIPAGLLAAIAGEYALSTAVLQLRAQPDDSLLVMIRADSGWTQSGGKLKHRNDGWFASDEKPLVAFKVVDAGGTQYILRRAPDGYGHYVDPTVFAQRVRSPGNLSAAWSARLSATWLVANENPDSPGWPGMDPRLRLAAIPELNGLIAVRPPAGGFNIVDPSRSDTLAGMMLVIPQANGRDLDDLNIMVQDGEEWSRFGSYVFRPLATVAALPRGAATTVTIGPEGYAEWHAVASAATPVQITITTTGAWRLFDPAFAGLANGKGNGTATLPAGSGPGYLLLFGDPGQTATVTPQ